MSCIWKYWKTSTIYCLDYLLSFYLVFFRLSEGSRVFPLFVVGALLMGVAGTGPVPLGLSYIDENVPKDRSAAYMGKN